jgi:TolB-like protein
MRFPFGVFMGWIVLLTLSFFFFAGGPTPLWANRYPSDIDGLSRVAGDMLEKNRLYFLDRTLPILSTSFVNLDNLKETSAFGRLMGVRVASRFSQHGYRVVELRLGKGRVAIQEKNGEFVLSNETARLDGSHDAQAIIVGTYSLDENRAFVSARIVGIRDNTVISSYDFSMRMDDTLKSLAGKKAGCVIATRKAVEISDIEESKAEKAGKNPISNGSILLKLSNPLAAKIIQTQLSRLGYYTWEIDGIWKTRSRKALAAFKKERKLPDATRWDLETQVALFNPKS